LSPATAISPETIGTGRAAALLRAVLVPVVPVAPVTPLRPVDPVAPVAPAAAAGAPAPPAEVFDDVAAAAGATDVSNARQATGKAACRDLIGNLSSAYGVS
jgi:hypothetical protein